MKAEKLNPQLRAVYRFAPNPPIRWAWGRSLVRAALKILPTAKLPDGVRSEQVHIPGGDKAIVFTPASGGNGAALLYMHGGGMVIGTAAQESAHLARIAAELDIITVSVNYRLSPEYPYPVPMDDCYAAWNWLQDSAAERGIDPERIVIGGQSAGGGLAAGLAQSIHDSGGPQPRAQWLFCPMLDDRTAARRKLDPVKHYLWNNASNRAGWACYLGHEPGLAPAPDYSAPSRRSDLTGLPEAWIGTGDIELFFEENRDYADALRAAEVKCELDIVPGAPHAFESVAVNTELARSYMARAKEWLRIRTASPKDQAQPAKTALRDPHAPLSMQPSAGHDADREGQRRDLRQIQRHTRRRGHS